jgi:hypothetical protein
LDPGVVLIEKPFTQQGLLAKVREVLDAEPPGSPSGDLSASTEDDGSGAPA